MSMKLQIELQNVVLATQMHAFVAVQLDYQDKVTPTLKFRTDLAPLANRPNFKRNLFTFPQVIQLQKARFGLMCCQSGEETSVTTAKMVGSASLSLSLDRLKSLPSEGHRQILHFMNKEKDLGQFECIIRYTPGAAKTEQTERTEGEKPMGRTGKDFNPLISRILFTEERAKDDLKMEASLGELERQMTQLYKTYSSLKEEQESLEQLVGTLNKDLEEAKSDIETYERINEKIASKINQKEHLEALRLEIDMLKTTEEGKRLLLERLEYFEERILVENEEYRKLAERYDQLKGEIERRIKSAEDYAGRLRGKEMQQFELQRNEKMLGRYEEVEYEFSCNQHIIRSLAGKLVKTDLTADQAALLLSQVNFHIQLEEVSAARPQEGILRMIEGEAAVMGKYEPERISEEERLVLEIKLGALQEEISNIRNKIKRVLPRGKGFTESQVTPLFVWINNLIMRF